MLQNIKELYGAKLAAADGDIGKIKDFYFDDKGWAVRYLVADTGSWLTGRLVLLSPHALGRFDQVAKVLPVELTRKQIEDSPSIETEKPVSRQHEVDYYRHYGWPSCPRNQTSQVARPPRPTRKSPPKPRGLRAN